MTAASQLESDYDIIARYHAGDRQAFTTLVNRWTPQMKAHLNRCFHNIDAEERSVLVDDTLQEVWLRLYRHSTKLDPTRKFSAWLYTVATNLANNVHRDRKRRLRVMERWPLMPESTEEMEFEDTCPSSRPDLQLVEQDEHQALIEFIMSDLTPEHREVLLARFDGGEGHHYEDIAQRLGIPVGTVKSRLSRVRRALQRFRRDYGRDA